MTDIASIGSINDPQSAAAGAPAKRDKMGKEDFLLLLVTQLSNQDPLNPQDGAEFASQLAQFTSVEQLTNIGKELAASGETNGMLAQSINSGVAAGLIGKQVEAGGNRVGLDGSGGVDLGFELGRDASATQITIRNASGAVVDTIDLGAQAAGRHTIEWDGQTPGGDPMAEGVYTFEVAAASGEERVDVRTFTMGRVDRVTFGHDGISLWVNGAPVPMSEVRSVEEAPGA